MKQKQISKMKKKKEKKKENKKKNERKNIINICIVILCKGIY